MTLRSLRFDLHLRGRRIVDHVRRPVRHALGCRCAEDGEPVCIRCGEPLYEGLLFWGWVDAIRWFLERFVAFRRARCAGCGKKLGRWHRGRLLIEFCSDPACERDWIPF